MNTSQIKNFATQSRNLLKAGVMQRILILGFDADGNSTKGEPSWIDIRGGATLFGGEVYDGAFYNRWMSLRQRIQEKGVKEVYEEAAYTWFNRLVAIRIMQKNGFIDPVLAYTNEQTRIPRIVAEARAGRVGQMAPADREKLRDLMGDDARINEQFALLIDNFCRNNAVIFNCFGGIEEYISLLLPNNILAPGGFIDLLNHTDYITDADYKQSELIGWLYQFYISEKKDEVFAKQGKYDLGDIPAATQIFTPNWIVKYMVQNTIGRIYLDNNPWATGIKEQMKYLVEPAEPTPKDAILKLESVEDYKLLDNACGSGHILVEAFSLFYMMYLEEGYSSHNAIESILRKNLLGIDLDTRAKQLATFALLMTAAKIDPSFLDCKVMPRVLDMPGHSFSQPIRALLREFYMGEDRIVIEETVKAFELLEQADNLGSIMKFDLSAKTRKEMALRVSEWELFDGDVDSSVKRILPSINFILALTDLYSAVVTNPPYMKGANMNEPLLNYVKAHYIEGKHDMFAVFMLVGLNSLERNGKMSQINMQSWMFITRYEKLRETVLNNYHFDSMIHLGANTFDEMSGAVLQNTAFVISNRRDYVGSGRYFRVTEGNCCSDKESLFLDLLGQETSRDAFSLPQSIFLTLPEQPIIYHLSAKMRDIVIGSHKLEDFAYARVGMFTGDNNRFLREWWEVSLHQFFYDCMSYEESVKSEKRWYPYNKGGGKRRWYGNMELVVNYQHGGYEVYELAKPENRNCQDYPNQYKFVENVTWSTAGDDAFRLQPAGSLFDTKGMSMFIEDKSLFMFLLGYCNSVVGLSYLKMISPGIDTQVGQVRSMPTIIKESSLIDKLVKENISIAKKDWDARETSWDFKENELLRIYKDNHGEGLFKSANKLEEIVARYKEYWSVQFNQLHTNEEELNRQFIEIYGLQDELTLNVPLDEVTILQQGEITVEAGQLVWHNDVLAKQLLSYAIGCMMGRYRLDRPGLHIAYPNPSSADVEAYDFQGEKFEIDDDGIIPLLCRDCPFEDNAYNRVVKFVRQVFGENLLNENLNFIEASLGKSIEDYFVKDYWKDHKKMYSNRPIYWLFSSKKGAFQCLAYMHRMTPYTAEKVRSNYLLRYIDSLKGKIAVDLERASSLSTAERRNLDKMQKALDECLEYEELLHDVADRQIRFDLDDGVVVNYAKFGDAVAKIK